jgi:hypothetical protein
MIWEGLSPIGALYPEKLSEFLLLAKTAVVNIAIM